MLTSPWSGAFEVTGLVGGVVDWEAEEEELEQPVRIPAAEAARRGRTRTAEERGLVMASPAFVDTVVGGKFHAGSTVPPRRADKFGSREVMGRIVGSLRARLGWVRDLDTAEISGFVRKARNADHPARKGCWPYLFDSLV
jgi:hypothetical protein